MKVKGFVIITVVVLLLIANANVFAGSSVDYGTVPGTPPIGEVNWLAWLEKNITPGGYPSEIMSEDSTSPGNGTNQGYAVFNGLPRWVLQVANFSNEADNDSVVLILGGLGASSGNGWTDGFSWSTAVPFSDQGEAATLPGINACPVMGLGSQNASGKTINWSGTSTEHLVYRSQLPSGAGNGASNGRYSYVASVPSGTFSYLDTACPTGTDCWHIVVPTNGSGVIFGCHSEESNPTAITLSAFSASSHIASPWMLILGVGLLVIIAAAAVFLRKRSKVAA